MQEIADDICTLLADGESLRDVCRRPGMPNKATVFRWLAENEVFRDQYAKATDVRADVIFDEIIDIADSAEADASEVAKARLKIDARKWVLSRMAPKKYGERITQEVTGKDGGPVVQVNYTPEDYARAQAELERMLPDLD
ncbi:ubiquitin carboxyl-hydrolase [Dickeya oryzae]|uniref:terminase small subunit-like protein n=1 Tax=Dickeya oryzae TaxID=1240404 RepID=UPI001AECE3FF|nr:ubiquitin carboxyl-hydrolase [Dickeya oryzae]MBP2844577.1 ubiquitin carboxyl-hydrolase [Dickeya oryzae]